MNRLSQWLDRLRQTRRAFGARATARFLFDRLLARTVNLDVEAIVWLPEERVRIGPEQAPGFEFRFLSAEEVDSFAEKPEYHLTRDFGERIRRGRDFCYAALAPDGRLAAYGWYALEEIEPEHCGGAAAQLPTGVAYMYKGYTHPDFRGARLHGAGMGGALQALAAYGVHSLISIVHWANFASLRSCERLGYETLGHIVSWRVRGPRHLHVPPPGKVHDVRLGAYCEVHEPQLVAV
jgi:L-amino acid N-acyltransferase YncA